jgi:hypothetical protein
MSDRIKNEFAWYLDITLSHMFSLYDCPIIGKAGLPLCELHGNQLVLKEVVFYDEEATHLSLPDYYWVCEE